MGDAVDRSQERYNDCNRAFLQSFMARGTMTFPEAQRILAAIFQIEEGKPVEPAEVTMEDFQSYRDAAADALSPFDYEIKSMQHQQTKERYYSLVNSTSDPLTQMATVRTPEEIGFVKRMLDAMFETHNTKRREVMAVTGMQALEKKIVKGTGESRESGTQVDKGLTGQEAERCLSGLVAEGWFEHSREGFYTLSPRALMELRPWLIEVYNDPDEPEEWQPVKFCVACKEIITVGQRCSDLECNIRLHDICDSYWGSRPGKDCPSCRRPWDGKHFVGQRSVTKTDDHLRGKRRNGGAGSSRRAREEEVARDEEGSAPEPESEGQDEEEHEDDENDDDE